MSLWERLSVLIGSPLRPEIGRPAIAAPVRPSYHALESTSFARLAQEHMVKTQRSRILHSLQICVDIRGPVWRPIEVERACGAQKRRGCTLGRRHRLNRHTHTRVWSK